MHGQPHTTQPIMLCHITEELNPHLGSAYRMWRDIHLPHFLFPSNCSRNIIDAGLHVSDATHLSVVTQSHKDYKRNVTQIMFQSVFVQMSWTITVGDFSSVHPTHCNEALHFSGLLLLLFM